MKDLSLDCANPLSRPIFQANYPGTVDGCNCLHVSWSWYRGVRKNKLNPSSCNYNETRSGCNDIPGTPQRMLEWSDHSQLCGIFGNSTESFKGMMNNMN